MDERTLKYAQEQLSQLRQSAMMGRQYEEADGEKPVSMEAGFIFKDKTGKYAGMIESFECDFSIAAEPDAEHGLDELQLKIEQSDNRLLSDIKLLKELSYGIRCGTLRIVELQERGGDPPSEE